MPEELEKNDITAAVELEEVTQCKRRIKFSVPFEEVQREFDAAYEEVKNTVQIPGFRPGKAPRHILEIRLGKTFREAALNRIRRRALGQAVLSRHLKPVSSPQFENILYEKGEPFTFEATMEVIPDITLSEYKGIRIERSEPLPATEEEVNAGLEEIRHRLAQLATVEDRPLRDGDTAIMTYEEEADGRVEKFERETVEIAEGFVLPGFIEKVRGMNPGEKREFQIQVPENYIDREAAGKLVSYRVQLDELKSEVPPPADDALAKQVGYESLESLRRHIHTNITERREREAEDEEISEVVSHLLRTNDFDVPESLLVDEVKRRAQRRVNAAYRSGISAERIRENREAILQEAAAGALSELKMQILVPKIAEKEGIEVSDAEVEARIERLASAREVAKDVLIKRYEKEDRLEDIRYQVLEQKVITFLHNCAIKE